MHGFVSYRSFGRARSLRSDQAGLVRGPMAILELVRGRFGYVSVAFRQSWTLVGLEISLEGCLLWPSVAVFTFSGLSHAVSNPCRFVDFY
ncbi:hypothetical protein F2Q68_00038670 [Brassica cretica]|uniref:Uncharacterized protein n=2 Tax=Brassica cretica TaxID=69181 RepID=A0A3N6SLK5_BRACR|nr:hypothetical protein F2Q68_00038670 [Brassica cretica]KAF3492811.1 hypothetical protein DY000_02052226 [Brassica cretica]